MTTFQNKQKALDLALWQNHNHRFNDNYVIIASDNGNYTVLQKDLKAFKEQDFEKLPVDYSKMSYKHIQDIRTDYDPLPHWEEIAGMFSTAHGEVLRFILSAKVPLEKFIRYELSGRGYDENFKWVGFEEAEKIWLK